MIGVHALDADSSAAVAALPESAFSTDVLRGSVVVIDGRQAWTARVLDAVAAGAVGIVVADPAVAHADELAHVQRALRGIPVVLDRPLLRADSAVEAADRAAGLAAVSLITASCASPAAQFDRTVCDTAGWLRVLAGAPVHPSVLRGRGGGVLLAADAGPAEGGAGPLALTARILSESVAAPRLRVTAIGVVRTEVSVTAGRPAVVRQDDERGTSFAATRFEDRRRLALRRAIAAVAGRGDHEASHALRDLADFAADSAIALAVRDALAP
ncbi:hypothetical protein ACEXQD_03215 [Herbiconiux sp. P15]|uniref:hypothetical protein n=1 Tax=Herbiconiux liukaitaii TaxID=3342799 RepID=UPI0035B88685